ncbi:MAG: glycosyltransferase family 2 protein [bacterium]|nr:glycosyltransferase family 2 protein [bacterium]
MNKISVLIPVYNECKNIVPLHEALNRVTKKIPNYRFEYIFINDGSDDDTEETIAALIQNDNRIKHIELSRNFGKEIALTAGLDAADADAVIMIDADLQHPPALIPELIKKWEEGYEIVGTKRTRVQHSLTRKFASYLFFKIQKIISDVPIHPRTTDFMLLDKKIVHILQTFTERDRMVRRMIDWMGFKRIYIDFEAPARANGSNNYSYKKLFRLAVNSLTGFSLFPLRLAGYLGTLITSGFGLLLTYMLCRQLIFQAQEFTARAYVFTLNSILIGIVLMCLGFIALYIGNIHHEVTNRPLYIIRKKDNFNEPGSPEFKVVQGRG